MWKMVASCSACKQRFIKGVTFHSFPESGQLCEKWVDAISRKGWTPSKSSAICSRHFTSDCYEQNGWSRVYLKADAVPSIFCFDRKILEELLVPDKGNSNSENIPEPGNEGNKLEYVAEREENIQWKINLDNKSKNIKKPKPKIQKTRKRKNVVTCLQKTEEIKATLSVSSDGISNHEHILEPANEENKLESNANAVEESTVQVEGNLNKNNKKSKKAKKPKPKKKKCYVGDLTIPEDWPPHLIKFGEKLIENIAKKNKKLQDLEEQYRRLSEREQELQAELKNLLNEMSKSSPKEPPSVLLVPTDTLNFLPSTSGEIAMTLGGNEELS